MLTPETERRIELLFRPGEREAVRTILVEQCGTNIPFFGKAPDWKDCTSPLSKSAMETSLSSRRPSISQSAISVTHWCGRALASLMLTAVGDHVRNGRGRHLSPTASSVSK